MPISANTKYMFYVRLMAFDRVGNCCPIKVFSKKLMKRAVIIWWTGETDRKDRNPSYSKNYWTGFSDEGKSNNDVFRSLLVWGHEDALAYI